jgi:SAM-dependent methyltransferase
MNTMELENAFPLLTSDHKGPVVASGYDFEYGTTLQEFSFQEHSPSGILALDPRPAPASLGIIYPDEYEPYQFEKLGKLLFKLRALVQRKKVNALQQLLPPEARILDLGCGNGALLRLIRNHRAARQWELHGNDLSKKCMDQLRMEGFQTHYCSCTDIDLPQFFDAIILNQVIEHFANPAEILESCKTLLKPGGILFIETPSTDGLDARLFRGRHWGGYHFPRHFYLFNASNLRMLLEEKGFQITSTRYLASPAFWLQSLHHKLMDKGFGTLAKLFHLKNIPLTAAFTVFDTITIVLGAKSSNMRIIARNPA